MFRVKLLMALGCLSLVAAVPQEDNARRSSVDALRALAEREVEASENDVELPSADTTPAFDSIRSIRVLAQRRGANEPRMEEEADEEGRGVRNEDVREMPRGGARARDRGPMGRAERDRGVRGERNDRDRRGDAAFRQAGGFFWSPAPSNYYPPNYYGGWYGGYPRRGYWGYPYHYHWPGYYYGGFFGPPVTATISGPETIIYDDPFRSHQKLMSDAIRRSAEQAGRPNR